MKNIQKYMEVLQCSELFTGIAPDSVAALLEKLKANILICTKGEYLVREGQQIRWLGLLLEGTVCVIQEDFWGNRHMLSKLTAGNLFAEAYACTPERAIQVSVAAQTEVVFLKLDAGRVLEACNTSCADDGRFLRNLLAVIAGKCIGMNEKLTHMSKRSLREKLLSYLSAQAQAAGRSEFDIPFSRQQLADYLSVDRSALSAQLGRLRDEGQLVFHKNHFELRAEKTTGIVHL